MPQAQINLDPERYQNPEVIGQGGMGVVLKAFDKFLGIDVAIKVLNKDDSGIQAARLQREAITAGKLNHPNIARVFDFNRNKDDIPYMVMELLQGQTLTEHLEKNGPPDLEHAISIFIQICEGLGHAHSHGLVHRDLKPSNVMLVENNGIIQVKLLDFGVAKMMDATQSLTASGAVVGSAPYMSPEQSSGANAELDSRSDIYSLGCLMYETLIGKPPFLGESALQTISMHRNEPAPKLADSFPPELVELVDSSLAKSPKERPQNTDEIISVLDPLNNQLKEARLAALKPKEESVQGWLFRRSRAMKVGVAICAVSIIGAGAYFGLVEKDRKNSEKEFEASKSSVDGQKVPIIKESAYIHDYLENEHQISGYQKQFRADGRCQIVATFLLDEERLAEMKDVDIWRLDLESSGIKGDGLKYLVGKPILEMDFKLTQIDDNACKTISQFKELTKLEIDSPNLTDKGLRYLAALPGLKILRVCSPKISDVGLSYLASSPQLETLEISNTVINKIGKTIAKTENYKITDACFKNLTGIKSLKSISFLDTGLSANCGAYMSLLPQLESFYFGQKQILSDESFRGFGASNLQKLYFFDSEIDEKQFEELAKCKSLKELHLGKSKISLAGLMKLCKLPNLDTLAFNGSRYISDELIDVILYFKLKTLILDSSNISESQFIRLGRMKSLETLSFIRCDELTETAIQTVGKIFAESWKKRIFFRSGDTELWRSQ